LPDCTGDLYPAVVSHRYGKGRSVYFAGHSPEYGFYRLLRRAIFYAARAEDRADDLEVVSDQPAYVYAYPQSRHIVVTNNGETFAKCILRVAPSVFHVQGKVRLVDVVTGESVFRGPSQELERGTELSLPTGAIRLLRWEVDGP